jgi:isoleucyl-tRNA synthetase
LKEISAALAGFGHDEVARLEAGASIEIAGVALNLEHVLLQRKSSGESAVATDGELTVVLHTHVDEALGREGIAREFISVLQNARRDADLEVSDRIKVSWSCDDAQTAAALREHSEAIAKETLASEFVEGGAEQRVEVNGVAVGYTLARA